MCVTRDILKETARLYILTLSARSTVKKFLAAVIEEELAPIRERRKEWEQNIPAVYDILKRGSEEARRVAASTLDDVRRAMRINYFDDMDLVSEQSKKYSGK